MKRNKKVLVITYYWPPAGGPGVQRILKFVKYLPNYGWQPVVLTVKNGDFVARDDSLLSDIPSGISIHKVATVEFYSLYRRLTGKKRDDTIPIGAFMKSDKDHWKDRLAKWVRTNFFVPDGRIGWIFPAILRGNRLIRKENISAVLSTSPPQSLQLSAMYIAKANKIPWVADFRDPWTETIFYQDLNRLKWMEKLDYHLERKVLSAANSVLTVSASIARRFREKIDHIACDVLPNGYDDSDFDQIGTSQSYEKFRLAFVGNLKSNQNPDNLWRSLADVMADNAEFRSDFNLQLTGRIDEAVERKLEEHGLLSHTKIEDYVPHTKAVKKMKEATVLLYVIPDAPENLGVLTGKLFEYLASGRPFLSIGPVAGDAASILQEAGAGPMYSPDNYDGIRGRIRDLYRLWKIGQLHNNCPDTDKVKQYERKLLTEKLANILNQVTGS